MAACVVLCSLISIVSALDSNIVLESESIDVVISDRYAFITYLFEFSNTNNRNASELSYQISLQPHTFISYFMAELNGKIFRGETKEKSQAQAEYNTAVELGLNAVLVSQNHDANVFGVRTNIEAGGVAKLNITAEAFMLRTFGYYQLSLLVDPIYTPNAVQVQINLYDEDVISFTDMITSSNTAYQITQESSNAYSVDMTVTQASGSSTEELILFRYKTQSMDNNNQLLFDASSSTFMHIFSYEDKSVLPRRVVFILDRSGSMGTTKWQSAVAATVGAIENLKPNIDRMNIILFDEESIKYASSMVLVTESVISDSISWINGYRSDGSTNLYQAVIDGLNLIKNDINTNNPYGFVNQVILVTDGQPTAGVTDPTEIQNGILTANDELSPALCAIFVLGIGQDSGNGWVTDLNYPLLRSIATQNEGFDARIKQSETEQILADYYSILESPVLSYIIFNYGSSNSLTRNKFRGLYSGTDIVVCGKTQAASQLIVTLIGYRAGEAVSTETIMTFDSNSNDNYVVDRIWAFLQLQTYQRLIDNPRLSVVASDAFDVQALNLALQYEFVTPWTSMIVVDDTIVNETETGDNNEGDTNYAYEGDLDSLGGLGGITSKYYSPYDSDLGDDSDQASSGQVFTESATGGSVFGIGLLIVVVIVCLKYLGGAAVAGFCYMQKRKKQETPNQGNIEEMGIALQPMTEGADDKVDDTAAANAETGGAYAKIDIPKDENDEVSD